MRMHDCGLPHSGDCNCCKCRRKCADDCDRPPTRIEFQELRLMLPELREILEWFKDSVKTTMEPKT